MFSKPSHLAIVPMFALLSFAVACPTHAGWLSKATGGKITTPKPIQDLWKTPKETPSELKDSGGTPPAINYWRYAANPRNGGGFFQKQGNQWVEFQNGQFLARFQELPSQSGTVLLNDPGRRIQVFLDGSRALIRINNGNWMFLYNRAR